MPKGKPSTLTNPNGQPPPKLDVAALSALDGLLTKAVTEYVSGHEAAVLQRQAPPVHPVIAEMGARLLDKPSEVGVFRLGEPEFVAKAAELRIAFAKGLRRVARAQGRKELRVKAALRGDKLCFWYVAAKPAPASA